MEKIIKIDRKKVEIEMIHADTKSFQNLADRAGMSTDTLFKALDGSKWTTKTWKKIAEALNCNPLDLITTEGFPPPKANALANA